jgi:hypothetical protein
VLWTGQKKKEREDRANQEGMKVVTTRSSEGKKCVFPSISAGISADSALLLYDSPSNAMHSSPTPTPSSPSQMAHDFGYKIIFQKGCFFTLYLGSFSLFLTLSTNVIST